MASVINRGGNQQIILLHGRKLPRLVSPVVVLLICSSLVVVLLFLFPESAYHRFAMSAKTDAATIEYLRQLHRAQPKNGELSIALAEHLYNAGQYNEAQTVAGNVQGKLKKQAQWLSLQATFADYSTFDAKDAGKETAKKQLLIALQALEPIEKSGLTVAQVEALANMHLQLGQPIQAAKVYEALAKLDPRRSTHWLKESAKWFVAGGTIHHAIRVNERLLVQAETTQQRHTLLLERANYYEWSEQPLKAAEIYRQLHREGAASPIIDRKTIVYAQYFAGTDVLRDSLLRENARRTLSAAEIQLLANMLEHRNGQAQQAASVLSAWIARNGAHKTLSLRLAYLYWSLGEGSKALSVMNTYRKHFNSDVDSTLLYAQLAYENADNEEAYAALLALPHKQIVRADYLELLGELAWQQGDMPVVEVSYEKLYRQQAKAFYGERFFMASLANGKLAQAVSFLLTDGRALKHPALISQILSAAQAAGRDDIVGTLIDLAEEDLASFYGVKEFWLLYARYLMRHQGEEKAEEALLFALKQSPNSSSLQYGLLWFYLESQNKSKLPTVLRLMSEEAIDNEAFWPVYATAYVVLDQPKEALKWFDKYQQRHKEDTEWLLYFADILAVARYNDIADEVRQGVLRQSAATKEDVTKKSYRLAFYQAQEKYQTADEQWALIKQLLNDKPLHKMDTDELRFVFEQFQQYYSPRWLVRDLPLSFQKQRMAAYQRLYLALESNNRTDIEQLLADEQRPKQRLAANNKMVALERLGLYQQSLNVALNALQHNGYVNETEYQRHAAFMQQKYPRQLGTRFLYRNSQYLDEFTEIARLLWSHNNRWTSEIEQSYSKFKSEAGINEETMLTGQLRYRNTRHEARLKVGYNDSADLSNFFTAEIETGYWFTQRLQGSLEWLWQSQSYESEVFRLYGLKNTGKANMRYSLTPRSQVALSVARSEFKTRDKGHYLGRGLQTEAHYSYALLKGHSYALVPHISVVKVRNSLSTPYGPMFLPEEYDGVSAGIRLSRGNVDGLYPEVGGLRFSIDMGVAYSKPSESVGFNIDASVATSVFGSDELSIYADRNVIRNEAGDYMRSVGLRYEYFFGK